MAEDGTADTACTADVPLVVDTKPRVVEDEHKNDEQANQETVEAENNNNLTTVSYAVTSEQFNAAVIEVPSGTPTSIVMPSVSSTTIPPFIVTDEKSKRNSTNSVGGVSSNNSNNNTKENRRRTVRKEEVNFDIDVKKLQKLLKEEADDEQSLEALRSQLNALKQDVVVAIKNNFVLDRSVQQMGGKIKLLIKNHIAAEDMRKYLDKSLDKIKQKRVEEIRELSNEFKVYENLFFMLQKETRYLSQLTRLIRLKNVDNLIQTVVFTLYGDQYDEREEHLLLALFEEILKKEFENCQNIGEFMRANTAFTKMLSAMLKRTRYHNFLMDVIMHPIKELIANPDLNFEINPAKVYATLVDEAKHKGKKFNGPETVSSGAAEEDPKVQAIIKARMPQVTEETEKFLDRIFSSVNDTPYGLRFICKKIGQYGRERFKNATADEINSLVGGFIFLRFFCPAITAPDNPDRRIIDFEPDPIQRKNLTMICKILQSLSNGIPFGTKEAFMIPLNEFTNKHYPRISKYFEELCKVEDVSERLEFDKFLDYSKPVERVVNISFNEVALIHEACVTHINVLAPNEDDPLRLLVQELNEMGPPPQPLVEKDNYFFNLTLRDRFKLDFVEEQDDPLEQLYSNTLIRTSNILKNLPMFAKGDEYVTLDDVLRAGKAHAIEKENFIFANQIKEVMDNLLTLEKEDVIAVPNDNSHDRYSVLLTNIEKDIKTRSKAKQEVEKQIARLSVIKKEVDARHEYLQSQLELYKQYFQDIRRKTYNPSASANKRVQGASGVTATVGPFKFKFRELEKQGVITGSSLPVEIRKNVTVMFSSNTPGIFNVIVSVKGLSGLKKEFDLDDLLEKQAKGEKELKFESVVLNLDMLILILNKLFVLGRS